MAKKNPSTGYGGKAGNINKTGWIECNVHPRHGGGMIIESLEELVTLAAAATTASTIAFPAGSIGLAANTYTVAAADTATNYDVGVSGTATRYGTNISDTVGTTNEGVSVDAYTSATTILFTPDATPTVADGQVYLQIIFMRPLAIDYTTP